MQATDEQLVAAACQGDLASFGQLYDRHYRLAVAIARSRLSDWHLAEDAAQESFAIVCRTLGKLQQGDRFPQWLGTICRRTASRLALGRPNHEPLSDYREPVNDSSLAMLREQVHEAVEQLDESSREIVLLHYFGGLTYDDIAGVIGLSTQAIHGRLQRARRKLAEILDATGAKE